MHSEKQPSLRDRSAVPGGPDGLLSFLSISPECLSFSSDLSSLPSSCAQERQQIFSGGQISGFPTRWLGSGHQCKGSNIAFSVGVIGTLLSLCSVTGCLPTVFYFFISYLIGFGCKLWLVLAANE